ncbi:MAG: hypothetical protein H6738_13755 [Alphaproteobacteria bacterium]|nr:hypothetical protein [Alphaproteobacteria bacterium]MCB9697841.1 hypothetical protein [Alphaproteobacteria bacterium]
MRRGTAALIASWIWLAWHTAQLDGWTVDDAYITYRYADNVVAGYGAVYNPGEAVEGYTSPLWLLLLSAGHAAGADLEVLGRWAGLVLGAATPAIFLLAPRLLGLSGAGTAAAVLLVGTSPILSAWAGGGLEVPLGTALVAVSWLLAARDRDDPGHGAVLGGLGAALVLTRPDLALIPLVQLLELAVRRRWRAAGALAGVAAAVLAPHEAWRLWTYHWPLPNTFYAKVGARTEQVGRGLTYLWGMGLACAAPVVPWLAAARLGLPRWCWAPMAWMVLHVAYVVAVGGDGLPAWRFGAPLIPVAALIAGAVVDRGRWWWLVALPLAAAQMSLVRTDRELNRMPEDRVARSGAEVGRWLREHEPPGTLVATNAAGAGPYHSRLPTLDMLGLCDEHIAHAPMAPGIHKAGHEKADGAYVLARQPDLVLFGASRGRDTPFFVSDKDLWKQPGFQEQYVLERHTLPSGAPLFLFRRRP